MKNFKIGDKVHTKIRDIGYDHLNDLDGTVMENCQMLCKSCNRTKSDK